MSGSRLSKNLRRVRYLLDVFEALHPGTGRPSELQFVAHVVSPSFEGMDDGERQYQVWERVRQRFGLQASVDIEFVFTYSPGEWEELLSSHSSVG